MSADHSTHPSIHTLPPKQVLVDGPSDKTGVARQVIPLKRVSLTDIKVRVPRNARAKTLKKAWEVRACSSCERPCRLGGGCHVCRRHTYPLPHLWLLITIPSLRHVTL